jgi:protein-tyrosine phosphatase
MKPVRRVLFVCTGNICRSAMAEHLLRHLSQQKSLGLEVSSCGIAAESYYEVPQVVHRLLSEKGVPSFEHRARLLTRDVLRPADLILAMTDAHREFILERFPEFGPKVHLFCEYAGMGEKDVEDPMGRPDEVFVSCLKMIEGGLAALIASGFQPVA